MYAPEFEFVCDSCWNVTHISQQHQAEYLDDAGKAHTLYLCSSCVRQQEQERLQELEKDAFERKRGLWE